MRHNSEDVQILLGRKEQEMTDHKFTDDEIIKALECIASKEAVLCAGCEYKKYDGLACHRIGARNALALINHQKAEIKRLQRLGASVARRMVNASAERNEARNDYVNLIVDIKTNGVRGICDICKHNGADTDCCCDCDDCYSEKCVCRDCRDCDKWEWRGRNESQNT